MNGGRAGKNILFSEESHAISTRPRFLLLQEAAYVETVNLLYFYAGALEKGSQMTEGCTMQRVILKDYKIFLCDQIVL